MVISKLVYSTYRLDSVYNKQKCKGKPENDGLPFLSDFFKFNMTIRGDEIERRNEKFKYKWNYF